MKCTCSSLLSYLSKHSSHELWNPFKRNREKIKYNMGLELRLSEVKSSLLNDNQSTTPD